MANRFVNAGKELLKLNIGNAFKSLSPFEDRILIPSEYRGESGFWFFGSDGCDKFFTYGNLKSAIDAYIKCPSVSAIINKKAQAFINGKVWVLNTQGKEAQGSNAQKLRKLLERPNPLQSWKQFEAQGYVYQQLFGYNIVLPIKPAGFKDNIDATSLWNIPPYMVDIYETNKLFYQTDVSGIIQKIVLRYKGETTVIDVNDVMIQKDFVPSFSSMIFPESRICALELPINNSIGAWESRRELINFRGARGILTNKTHDQIGHVPMNPAEEKDIHDQFKKGYGMRSGQRQFIMTTSNLSWQQIGQQVKELMLFEEIESSTMAICDGFGYPYRLLSQEKSASYNDVKEFKKLLYQDTIIPEADSAYEQWNKFFKTSEYSLKIDKDFSHVSVLQEDQQKQASTRKIRNEAYKMEWRNGLLTLDEWRKGNGEDPLPDGRGKVYFPEYVAQYGDPDKGISSSHQNNNDENSGQENGQAQS